MSATVCTALTYSLHDREAGHRRVHRLKLKTSSPVLTSIGGTLRY